MHRPIATILLVCAAAADPAASQTRTASADAMVRPVSATSFALPVAVTAEVVVEHLLLSGDDYRSVQRLLGEVGPLAADGELANGVTDYDLVPRLTPVSDGRTCRTSGVRVDVRVRILLPEWVDRNRAAMPERRRWQRFLSRLTSHENAHRDITLRAAESLDAELRRLKASSCSRLIRRIDGAIRAAQAGLDDAHAALDAADRSSGA